MAFVCSREVLALRLTDEGEALRRRTAAALAELADASDEIAGRAVRPRGLLRLSVPGYFAQQGFGAFAAAFAAAYPDVTLDVCVEDGYVDPIADGFDAVVRVNPASDSSLVGHRLLCDKIVVVARPDVPRPEAQQADVPAVVHANWSAGEAWACRSGDRDLVLRPRPVLKLTSLVLRREAIVAGAGVGLLPESAAARDFEDGRLARWGVFKGRSVELWILCPSARQRSAKVTALIAMLTSAYGR